jgi:hypothetical protein
VRTQSEKDAAHNDEDRRKAASANRGQPDKIRQKRLHLHSFLTPYAQPAVALLVMAGPSLNPSLKRRIFEMKNDAPEHTS